MDKKLESRIASLERAMRRKSAKNEAADQAANAVYRASNEISQIVNDLCKTLAYSNITNYSDVDTALEACENSFSPDAYRRLSSILNRRMNSKTF